MKRSTRARKLTPYQLRKHGRTGISSYIMSDTLAKRADQRGQPGDIIRAWRHLCKAKGWQRFGAFKAKSGFNIPYVLFKAKNVLDPATRAAKWHKARPISPATRHPMRTMLGKAGRAWYFLAHNFPGERFHIPNTGDIPTFLRQAVRRVRGSDKADIRVFDIEGCFPSMPKDAIRIAMRDLAARFRTLGHSGVFIPQARTKRCSWQAPRPHSRGTWMTFAELIDILEFSLDNTLIRMPDGRLLKQVLGIPMGDPLSPGMCIGTCAWMEAEWLAGMRASTKHFFKAARYMDDILMIMASPRYWDQERFLRDFTASECYWAPLKLEPCDGDVFLETEFSQTMSGRVRCRLKNVNSDTTRVWRYHDYRSHLDYATKRAVLLSTLRKVDRMCSDESMRLESAVTKCKEFLRLGYPEGIILVVLQGTKKDSSSSETHKPSSSDPVTKKRLSRRRNGLFRYPLLAFRSTPTQTYPFRVREFDGLAAPAAGRALCQCAVRVARCDAAGDAAAHADAGHCEDAGVCELHKLCGANEIMEAAQPGAQSRAESASGSEPARVSAAPRSSHRGHAKVEAKRS